MANRKPRTRPRVCRASAQEAAQAKIILSKIWKKAYLDREVVFRFPKDRIGAAKNLHTQLADYRKHVRERRLTMLEEWGRIASTSLIMADEFTVLLKRKESSRVHSIHELLAIGSDFPEMELSDTNHKNPISMIVRKFTTLPQLPHDDEP